MNKNIVAIHEIKPVLILDKPVYVGISVLDLSKLFMHDYHYNYFKRKFVAKLLFTDTDSLDCEIKTEKDVYKIFYKDKHLFDLSNYPKDSLFYDLTNINKIVKMEDESEGKINDEFVRLKPKMYSIKYVDGKENKTGKKPIMLLLKI